MTTKSHPLRRNRHHYLPIIPITKIGAKTMFLYLLFLLPYPASTMFSSIHGINKHKTVSVHTKSMLLQQAFTYGLDKNDVHFEHYDELGHKMYVYASRVANYKNAENFDGLKSQEHELAENALLIAVAYEDVLLTIYLPLIALKKYYQFDYERYLKQLPEYRSRESMVIQQKVPFANLDDHFNHMNKFLTNFKTLENYIKELRGSIKAIESDWQVLQRAEEGRITLADYFVDIKNREVQNEYTFHFERLFKERYRNYLANAQKKIQHYKDPNALNSIRPTNGTGRSGTFSRQSSMASEFDELAQISIHDIGHSFRNTIGTIPEKYLPISNKSGSIKGTDQPNQNKSESIRGTDQPNPNKSGSIRGTDQTNSNKSESIRGTDQPNQNKSESIRGTDQPNQNKSESIRGTDQPNQNKSESIRGTDQPNLNKSGSIRGTDQPNLNKSESIRGTDQPNLNKSGSIRGTDQPNLNKSGSIRGTDQPNLNKSGSIRGTDQHNPNKSGSIRGNDQPNPNKSGSIRGTDQHNPNKSGSIRGTDQPNPNKSGSIRGTDQQNPNKSGSIRGTDQQNPNKSGSIRGNDQPNPNKSGSIRGTDKPNPNKILEIPQPQSKTLSDSIRSIDSSIRGYGTGSIRGDGYGSGYESESSVHSSAASVYRSGSIRDVPTKTEQAGSTSGSIRQKRFTVPENACIIQYDASLQFKLGDIIWEIDNDEQRRIWYKNGAEPLLEVTQEYDQVTYEELLLWLENIPTSGKTKWIPPSHAEKEIGSDYVKFTQGPIVWELTDTLEIWFKNGNNQPIDLKENYEPLTPEFLHQMGLGEKH